MKPILYKEFDENTNINGLCTELAKEIPKDTQFFIEVNFNKKRVILYVV